ncbi:MAG: MmcQ/YjbR family DNA-binding protein [Gemmatimonadaceae bacterium]
MTPRSKRGVTFDRVTEIGLALPGVAVSPSYGTPSLKVKGALFARLKEDGETLVLKVDRVSRDLMLSAQPDLFFLTDHYRDYPYILVRLPRATDAEMRELIEDAWALAAPRKLVAERKSQPRRAK